MAQTVLTRTPSGAGNRKTWTLSTWLKRAGLGNNIILEANSSGGSSNTNYIGANFGGGFQLVLGGWTSNFLATSQFFTDPAAWYHIVIRVDTTQATADDRMRIYVNGAQVTSFSTRNNPGQNDDTGLNAAVATTIGKTMDGYMAQTILADGQSYAASTFGSTNANGIWVPNTSPSVTYGTNGFKLDYSGTGASADASGFGADTSGNGNHFASTNLGTNPSTTDTCQNNFAAYNSVANSSMTTLSGGALIATGNTASNNGNSDCTIAPAGGKWYWEVKYVTAASSSGANYPNIGAYAVDLSRQPKNGGGLSESGYWDNGCSYKPDGSKFTNNSTASYGTAWSAGDIIGVALDLENYAIYFSRNGTWQDSGDPTSGASKTGSATNFTTVDGEAFVPAVSSYNNSVLQTNFGNPPFAISSSNADANGEGSFEYAVPSGYYALCTNNLALYGG
jgi:hypothetical protein